jgi:hypothetical protein
MKSDNKRGKIYSMIIKRNHLSKSNEPYCYRINEKVANNECEYHDPKSRQSCKRNYLEIRPCDIIDLDCRKRKGLRRKLDRD